MDSRELPDLRVDLRTASKLYRRAGELHCTQFRYWALRMVESIFHYDAVLWATTSDRDTSGCGATTALVSGLPKQFALELPEARGEPIREILLRSGAQMSCEHFVIADAALPLPVNEHYTRFGIYEAIVVRHANLANGLIDVIAAFRFNPGPPLEAGWREQVVPIVAAIIDAASANLAQVLEAGSGLDRRKARAVTTPDGAIVGAQAAFSEIVERRSGAPKLKRLPFALGPAGVTQGLGHGLLASWEPLEHLALVKVWHRSVVDDLTGREADLVGKVLLGLSDKEIAAHFGLSAASVSNRLVGAFRKLGVASRYEFRRSYVSVYLDRGAAGADALSRGEYARVVGIA